MKQQSEIVIIGYGNELRSDDAVGPKVAELAAGWQLPGVRTLTVHQLTPELTEIIARASIVIFIDAALGSEDQTMHVRRIEPVRTGSRFTHLGEPSSLLALAEAAYGRSPAAWMLTVPAANLDFGERLSPLAERGAAMALHRVWELCLAG